MSPSAEPLTCRCSKCSSSRCTTRSANGRGQNTSRFPPRWPLLLHSLGVWASCSTALFIAATTAATPAGAARHGASRAQHVAREVSPLQQHDVSHPPACASSPWVLFDATRETRQTAPVAPAEIPAAAEAPAGPEAPGQAGAAAARNAETAVALEVDFSTSDAAGPGATIGDVDLGLSSDEGAEPAAALSQEAQDADASRAGTAAAATHDAGAPGASVGSAARRQSQPSIVEEAELHASRQGHGGPLGRRSSAAFEGLLKPSQGQQQQQQQQLAIRDNGPLAGVFRAFQQLAAAAASAAAKKAAATRGAQDGMPSMPPQRQQQHAKQKLERLHNVAAVPETPNGTAENSLKRQQQHQQEEQQQQREQQPQRQRLVHSRLLRLAPRIRGWLLEGVRVRQSGEALAAAADDGSQNAASGPERATALSASEPSTGIAAASDFQTSYKPEVQGQQLEESQAQVTERQPHLMEQEQALATACSWGTAAVPIVRLCLPVITVQGMQATARLLTPKLLATAATEAPSGKCLCIASRAPMLLQPETVYLSQQEQQQQQQQQQQPFQLLGGRLVSVSSQQLHMLLCCTRGFVAQEQRELMQAERLRAGGGDSASSGAAHAARSAVAAAAPPCTAAAGTAEFVTAADAPLEKADLRCWRTTPLEGLRRAILRETSPAGRTSDAVLSHVVAAPTLVAAVASGERAAGSIQSGFPGTLPDALPLDSAVDEASTPSGSLSGDSAFQQRRHQPRQRHQQRESGGDNRGETADNANATQLQEQQRQQWYLSSRWGGHLVFWTWRRSCMRQQQLRPSSAAATAVAAAAAAAACYRQSTTKSLALQLLLLLLPHDLAVRLIARRDPAQCLSQQPLQQQRHESVMPVAAEAPEGGPLQSAVQGGHCPVPVLLLGSLNSSERGNSEFMWSSVTAGSETLAAASEPAYEAQVVAKEEARAPSSMRLQERDKEEQWRHHQQLDGGKHQQYLHQQPAEDTASDASEPEGGEVAKQQKQQPRQTQKVQQEAASAVGGLPGAPQLYGRGFVRGTQLTGSFLRLHFNFASLDAGARIVASSSGMQHVKAVQRPDGDTYMLVPCSVPTKYFVLSFAETLKIEFVAFQSLEIYANAFWHIQLLGADTYPSRHWRLVANLQTAADVSSELFSVKPECSALGSCWARFLKVRLLTHHDEGSHYYCSLTSFQVFGATAVQVLETHLQDELGVEPSGLVADADEGAAAADALAAAATAAAAIAEKGQYLGRPQEFDAPYFTSKSAVAEGQRPVAEQHAELRQEGFPEEQRQPEQQRDQLAAGGAQQKHQEQRRSAPSAAASVEQQDASSAFSGNGANLAAASAGHHGHGGSNDRTAPEVPRVMRDQQSGDCAAAAASDPSCTDQREKAAAGVVAGRPTPTLDLPNDINRTAQQQQRQEQLLSLLNAYPVLADSEHQSAAAVSALSAALEEALQQQKLLLQQRGLQLSQQQFPKIHGKVPTGDAFLVEVTETLPEPFEEVGTKSNVNAAACISSSSNATSRWRRYHPLLQPTTRRYICAPAASPAASPPPAGLRSSIDQDPGHLVAINTRSSDKSNAKALPSAEAATEALQQAAAYARAFLLHALKHQRQPQQQQRGERSIGSAFVNFLMTASPNAPQQQAETLRVLSMLLQPTVVETATGGDGVSGRDPVGGVDSAASAAGPKDSKGEHVLVTLLERMKSLEGEAAAFRALAAERLHQMHLQQQQLLHITLLVQLQQQLGSFLFDRLSALDGLLPHVEPLVQLLDESVAAATAAATEEEELLRHAAGSSSLTGDAFCRNPGQTSSSDNISMHEQQQHLHSRHPRGQPMGSGFWSFLQQLTQPLQLAWSGATWLAKRLGADFVAFFGIVGYLVHQLVCSEAESAVLQQSCAAAADVSRLASSTAASVAVGAAAIVGFVCKGMLLAGAAAGAVWSFLSALSLYESPEVDRPAELASAMGSTTSSNVSWGQRLLLLQDRASIQSLESSFAYLLLLLLLSLLMLGALVLWRLRHGQRVAAAAAGECALLRRSFELLQQQHRVLQQQLQQFGREQELLLLLSASHHTRSRVLLQRTKSIGDNPDGGAQQQQLQQWSHVVRSQEAADCGGVALLAGIASDAFQGVKGKSGLSGTSSSSADSAAAKAASAGPSLLRRLSCTFAPRLLLGLSRHANTSSMNLPATCGSNGNSSGTSSGSNHSPGSGAMGSDRLAQQSEQRQSLLQQAASDGRQLLLQPEQQQSDQQQMQATAAALLPALDTKAIRGLKLQRHTLRQRRLGGATTPVASPGAAAVDGYCPLLSPAAVRETGEACDTHIDVASRDAADAAFAAPSRSNSSRISSVYSRSGHPGRIYKALMNTRASSTPLPCISLLLQSAQERAASRAGNTHRPNRNALERSYSSSGSCSSCSSSYVQQAARAATAAGPFSWHRSDHSRILSTSRSASKAPYAGSGSYRDCPSSSAADGSNLSETASRGSRSSSSGRSSGGRIADGAALLQASFACGPVALQSGVCKEQQRPTLEEDGGHLQSAWPLATSSGIHGTSLALTAGSLTACDSASATAGQHHQAVLEQADSGSASSATGHGVQASGSALPPMHLKRSQQEAGPISATLSARRDARRRRKKRGIS
ncbi:hypothetical protein Efla_003058 [Eimeria flavescens]